MTLPILPTAPSRTDPINFSVEADAWVAALGPWTDAANAMEASLQTSNLVGTSTTSLPVGTGSKGFTTQAGKAWIVGSYVFIVATSDRTRVMQGKVTAYNSGTGSLVVDVNIASGSGTYASWDIGIANPSIGATSGINVAGDTTLSTLNPALRFINGDSEEMSIQCLRAANGGRVLRVFDSVAGLERYRVTASGELLVGLTSSNSTGPLQVYSSAAGIADFSSNAGSQVNVRVRNTTANPAYLLVQNSVTGSNAADGFAIGINSAGEGILAQNDNLPIRFYLNNTECVRFTPSGDLLAVGIGAVGYGSGAGGTVTQNTSKSTGVTLNKVSGQITMNAAALAANTSVSFAVSCNVLTSNDVVVINLKSGFASNATYQVWINDISSGQFVVNLRNISAGSLSEAVVLSYVIIRGSTT